MSRKYYYGQGYENYDETDFKKIQKLLMGRKVEVVSCNEDEGILRLDNGIELIIVPNSGCGGCSSGWYYLTELNGVDNAITNVELVEEETFDEEWGETETSYKIFVFCEDWKLKLLQVDGTDGNGYYGSGYDIWVKMKKEG